MSQPIVYVKTPLRVDDYNRAIGQKIVAHGRLTTPITRQVFTLVSGDQAYRVDWLDGVLHADMHNTMRILLSSDGTIYAFDTNSHREFIGWLCNYQRASML